ncbi:hypothetical protein M8J77_022848 [Diaphorina citri]|nr:hypothetical protein M8J77_022848 [Diaphorina citri]
MMIGKEKEEEEEEEKKEEEEEKKEEEEKETKEDEKKRRMGAKRRDRIVFKSLDIPDIPVDYVWTHHLQSQKQSVDVVMYRYNRAD